MFGSQTPGLCGTLLEKLPSLRLASVVPPPDPFLCRLLRHWPGVFMAHIPVISD